ncbi:hypothetical protein LJC74_09560, partial [Eubacteriales bacterium OttesenSCG-928-A19]|nr:hypothetical protein [Eubacteriales bacterium OttesenSCG-928-A19]
MTLWHERKHLFNQIFMKTGIVRSGFKPAKGLCVPLNKNRESPSFRQKWRQSMSPHTGLCIRSFSNTEGTAVSS